MEKILNLKMKTRMEEGSPVFQKLWSEDDPRIEYRVANLWDCPEDACIHRDLFSADEWLDTLRLGMTLAQEGYNEIHVTYEDYEAEDNE